MNCARVERQLSGYLDGELRGRPAVAIAAHLEACPTCRARAMEFKALAADLRALPGTLPPDHLASCAVDRWLAERTPRPRLARLRPALGLGLAGFLLLALLRSGLPGFSRPGAPAEALLAAGVPPAPSVVQVPARPATGSRARVISPSKEQMARRARPESTSNRSRKPSSNHQAIARSSPPARRSLALPGRGRIGGGTRLARRPVGGEARAREQVLAQWVARAREHEIRGEHGQATAAYQQALALAPDPALAFAAGQSAEGAGDVAGAVTHYTQLFDAAPHGRDRE